MFYVPLFLRQRLIDLIHLSPIPIPNHTWTTHFLVPNHLLRSSVLLPSFMTPQRPIISLDLLVPPRLTVLSPITAFVSPFGPTLMPNARLQFGGLLNLLPLTDHGKSLLNPLSLPD